jgi:hypothetical protein
MSEKPARQPMTDGEREILFQVQQLQAKWFDTLEMCSNREYSHLQRVQELAQSVRSLTSEMQAAHLAAALTSAGNEADLTQWMPMNQAQMQQFKDECLDAVAQCRSDILAMVRQMMALNKAISGLTQEVRELRDHLTKDRLF